MYFVFAKMKYLTLPCFTCSNYYFIYFEQWEYSNMAIKLCYLRIKFTYNKTLCCNKMLHKNVTFIACQMFTAVFNRENVN